MSLKSKNNVETNKWELEVTVSPEAFEAGIQQAYRNSGKKYPVKGFRRGKAAPRKIIETTYGKEVFFEDAVNYCVPAVVDDAVKEAGLELVDRPSVELTSISVENGVEVKATCVVKPEVKIDGYKGIEVEKTVDAVTDEDVEKEANSICEKNSRLVTVEDRAAQDGDVVTIDFEGFKGGVAFEGGKSEDFPLTLGGGQFIPGFEEQIVGHSLNEEFEINVTFPEDYGAADLAGADAVFKIKIKEIQFKEVPALDDELVKDATKFETVDEYKADVKARLEKNAEEKADAEVEEKLFDIVVSKMEAEIPQEMFNRRIAEMFKELEQRLQMQGIPLETYMNYTGQTFETMREGYKEQAEKQVTLRLALEQIAKNENVEVTEEDLAEEYKRLSEEYGIPVDQIKTFLTDEDLSKDIAVSKAVDLVKDAAVIK